jgi:hypothetical protein
MSEIERKCLERSERSGQKKYNQVMDDSQFTFWDGEEEISHSRLSALESGLELSPVPEPPPRKNFRTRKESTAPRIDRLPQEPLEELPPEIDENGVDLTEARRIASELVKLWKMGIITGPDDPEAVFMASLIKMLGGTIADLSDLSHIIPHTRARAHARTYLI